MGNHRIFGPVIMLSLWLVPPAAGYAVSLGEYRLDGCAISKGGPAAKFPGVYDETLMAYGIEVDPYRDGRRGFGCATSNEAVEYGGKYWFYLVNSWNLEDVGEDYFSGFAYFDPKTNQLGILRVPALRDCVMRGLKLSSTTIYASSFIPGWDYGAKCRGIVGFDLRRNEIKSYYPETPLGDLEMRLHEVLGNPGKHASTDNLYSAELKKKIDAIGLEEYMYKQVLFEEDIARKVMGTARAVGSKTCRISESNGNCVYSGGNGDLTLTAVLASQKGCSPKGVLYVDTPYGRISPPANNIQGQLETSTVSVTPANGEGGLWKISFSNYKTFWTRCPGQNKNTDTFLYLDVNISGMELGGIDSEERKNKYVIDLRDLPQEIALQEPYLAQFMDYLTASTPTYTAAEVVSGLSDDSRDAFASAMIQALKVDRKSVRERAINFFKSDLENLLPYVLKEVDNPSMHVRRAISLLVRGQGEKARSVIPSLIQNLGAKDQSLVWDSRDTLEKLGIDPSEELLSALDSENVPAKSKERIAGILAEKRYSVAGSKLLELAKANTPLGHAAAACYLYLSSRPISNEMLPLYINAVQYQLLESVGYTGAEHAIREIPKLQTQEMVEALLSLLKSEDREVRIKVSRVLSSFPRFENKIVPALESLLQEMDLEIGEAAALSIGKLQPSNEKAIASLIRFSQFPDWPRDAVNPVASVVALGEMRAKQAVPLLKSLLSRWEGAYNKYIAACSLLKISPESGDIYIPHMIRVLDPQAVGRGFDVEVLKCLSGAGKYAETALPELKVRLSRTTDEKSRKAFLEAIQAIETGEN